jgi:hypothetical protein
MPGIAVPVEVEIVVDTGADAERTLGRVRLHWPRSVILLPDQQMLSDLVGRTVVTSVGARVGQHRTAGHTGASHGVTVGFNRSRSATLTSLLPVKSRKSAKSSLSALGPAKRAGQLLFGYVKMNSR